MKSSTRLVALLILGLIAAPVRAADPPPREFGGKSPLQWSVAMADSQITRRHEAMKPPRGRWDYANNVFLLSLVKLTNAINQPKYEKVADDVLNAFIAADGTIQGYRPDEYNIDHVNPGKTILALYEKNQDDGFKHAAANLRKQMETHPRTKEGGFWHKNIYPSQMWLDGLYMASPFLAQYGKLFNEPALFDEVGKQIKMMDEHSYDPKTGLFYHGYDESRAQSWADKATGRSPNFWSRAIGWYGMALVDVLDYLPANHPSRPQIIETLNRLVAGVIKHQDAESGLWYQVTDQGPRGANYLEATASSMFVYTITKAANKGYVSKDTLPAAIKGYSGIISRLIKTETDGSVTLTKCCSVAGLSNGRDGSFEYYLREPIVDNDMKGVGPFVMAGIELQQALGLPMVAVMMQANAPATRPTASVAPEWAQMAGILARIKAPTFPNRDFRITDFGAVAGESGDASEAIKKAIAAANAAGGGRVVVPPGVFITGPIVLKSNVNLHLDGGSTLKFKTDTKAYLPAVYARFEGMECYNYSPFIYAWEQENIAITGDGTIDGQGAMDNWWAWKRQEGPVRNKLIQMVADNVPVEQRQFGAAGNLRPNFIQPWKCKNVLIEGISIRRSPMWEINPVLCTNVIVRGVNIVSHGPNNDGCNPESCKDVLIENCLFDTGDDCIAIKSGRNNDGRRVGVASENIIIRNCTMKDGHGGVTLGSEISGGVRNVFIEDCTMDSPNLDRALRFKNNAVRGGILENVFMRNVTIGAVANEILQIDFNYEEGRNGPHKPVARNIVMENITSRQTPRVLSVVSYPNGEISGVRIYNSTFKNVKAADNVREADVKLENCVIERAAP